MLSKFMKTSVVLLSATMATAQTSSLCNPVKGQTCPADPAFGGVVDIDFTKGASEYFTLADGTTLDYDSSKGAVFTIEKDTNAPTITSTKYIFFGTVEAVIQAAPGIGIITSFVLQSDDLDEIDWEWLGGDTTEVQTNYFSKGDDSTFDRGGSSSVDSPQTSFHTYTVDWSPEAVVWSIDGTVVRTLTSADAKNGATFPQTPMQIKLGTWDAGGSSQPEGTAEWAGGRTPFGSGSGAPYIAYYKSIKVTDRSNGVTGATSYEYTDTSGTYESIKVNTDGETDNTTTTTSSSSKTSATKTSASTSTSTAATKTSTKASTTVTVSSAVSATGTSSGSSAEASTEASTTLVPVTTSSGTKNSSSASSAPSTSAVTTSGVSKVAANLVGIAGAMFAVLSLL